MSNWDRTNITGLGIPVFYPLNYTQILKGVNFLIILVSLLNIFCANERLVLLFKLVIVNGIYLLFTNCLLLCIEIEVVLGFIIIDKLVMDL